MSGNLQEIVDNRCPKWLNGDFIALHLKNYFQDQKIQIVQIDVRSATKKGENFASWLHRVNVHFVRESANDEINLNIIVKSIPMDSAILTELLNYNVYKLEIEFYNQIAPKINAALEQLNETKQLIANSYGVCLTNDVLLLEDLATKSYCISSVHQGFNFDETKIVLKKLASFHAANAVLQQNQPKIFENFKYGMRLIRRYCVL